MPNSEIQLVNLTALHSNSDAPVHTVVELEFSHREQKYNLTRAIIGMLENGRVIEELSDVRLFKTDHDGNTTMVGGLDINTLE